MKQKQIIWIAAFFTIVGIILTIVGIWTYKVDPFFHFNKPDTNAYFYKINNQRSQNDGISKNFDYDGIITGTSMTENFKTSEAENIFGGSFIKVPYSGGSFKEINDNLKIALSHNDKIKIIIRGLDMGKFIYDKDFMRDDLGTYPTYLYDDNKINDIQYIYNRDVIFSRVYPMTVENDEETFIGGITSFDSYSNWMRKATFGVNSLYPNELTVTDTSVEQVNLTDEERDIIRSNIQQNVTSLAEAYPDVTFYYFFTPYSAAWWQSLINT